MMKKPAGIEKELMDWANDPLSSANHAGTKFERMNAYRLEFDSLPDGAFFSLAEERHGWTVDDWAWFAKRFAQS